MLRAGVELVDGVDQPEDPVAHQVGLLDVVGEAHRDPPGDVLDERRVVEDQPVAVHLGAVPAITLPGAAQLGVVILVRLQRPGLESDRRGPWPARVGERERGNVRPDSTATGRALRQDILLGLLRLAHRRDRPPRRRDNSILCLGYVAAAPGG